ncbi:YceI family protein [Kitasatospora brasiliensis]|uniref:YceI family protein n=1 Tax=Kitasatospora brasiliensis TaxID=3058040 RepID=UPI00293138CA|nr:YceI family protein [Kitasatospora sp. K002]
MDPMGSSVRFETRALFGLLPVRGTLTVGRGLITVADAVEESSVDVVILAAGFESGNRQRDDHVRSADYLDADGHPEIGFRSARLERSVAGALLDGELTVRGTTGPCAVTVESIAFDGRGFTARGIAMVDRYAFGITKAKGMTGRYLTITVDITANPA